jgi:hypothetical protein
VPSTSGPEYLNQLPFLAVRKTSAARCLGNQVALTVMYGQGPEADTVGLALDLARDAGP